jgi:hypothetical protein
MTTKSGQNPMRAAVWMSNLALAHACPRCGARTRSGSVCKGQAMANGRCRMHGGASTGPRTAQGLQRIVQARTIHGAYRGGGAGPAPDAAQLGRGAATATGPGEVATSFSRLLSAQLQG